jgi:hypothetical protein
MPQNQRIPVIDYEMHPAFRALGANARAGDAHVDGLIDDIDESYNRIANSAGRPPEERLRDIKREILPRFDELHRRVSDCSAVRPEFASYIEAAMAIARASLCGDVASRGTELRNSQATKVSDAHRPSLESFHEQGFVNFSADRDLAKRVWAKTKLERAVVRSKSARLPNMPACGMSLHPQSTAYLALARAVKENGLLDIASAYMRKSMEIVYYFLELNQPQQNWYRDCYSDAGLSTSRTAYMHFDADRDVLKAMLYLNDVGPEDGPFSFIPGSHRWTRSPLVCAIHKGFDQAQWQVFRWPDNRRFYYYRPRFKLREQRPDTLVLPARLRGSTHFGDDIVDGSPLSEELLAQERVFAAPAGTITLFDGSQGVHRGGLVRSGARWVVQIGLRVKQAQATAPTSMLRGRLSFAKHSLKNVVRFAIGR